MKGDLDIEIVNIVVSTSLDREINLEKISSKIPYTEYNPETFPGLVLRIKDPKTCALIFSSGKVILTGSRTVEDVRLGLTKLKETLKTLDIIVDVEPVINIQNIVASGSIPMSLNLNFLALKLDNCEYEPETFPGLILKIPMAMATFLLFNNGKIVCTGCKNEEQVYKAVRMLIIILNGL